MQIHISVRPITYQEHEKKRIRAAPSTPPPIEIGGIRGLEVVRWDECGQMWGGTCVDLDESQRHEAGYALLSEVDKFILFSYF